MKKGKILITGSAGFIGFSLSRSFLKFGYNVVGIDNINGYYSKNLKLDRIKILKKFKKFRFYKADLRNKKKIKSLFIKNKIDTVYHLAAQAGVRYSLENPRAYINSNIVGTFNVMEVVRKQKVKHLLMASTSSVYGANSKMPFTEIEKTDTQLTIYAATKKANESMAHSYAHLWKIPTTMFRFFKIKIGAIIYNFYSGM